MHILIRVLEYTVISFCIGFTVSYIGFTIYYKRTSKKYLELKESRRLSLIKDKENGE